MYPDANALALAAARELLKTISTVTAEGRRFALALSGGTTPKSLYRLLGSTAGPAMPWRQVHIFWGDERYVQPDDPRSNSRMAKETWLDHAPIPHENVHPMPTHPDDPNEAARTYEATMRTFFERSWPRFDLMLLGLGGDGHTASLFPGSHALAELRRWVVPVHAPAEPALRLTVTLPVINNAERIWFLVSGGEKADVLAKVLEGESEGFELPAAAVRPSDGTVTWWVDRDAASLLRPSSRSAGA